MENLEKTKEKKHSFKYSTLIVCLLFYFLRELFIIKSVVWLKGRLVAHQIKDFLRSLGDSVTQDEAFEYLFVVF